MTTFSIIFDGKHGKSVVSEDPKLSAYQYIARIIFNDQHNNAGLRPYQLISHIDGAITVDACGLMPLTFERGN